MREAMIAKRYAQSLVSMLDATSLDNTVELFNLLATAFDNAKFTQIMNSNDIAVAVKTSLILSMVENAKSSEIDNIIKLMGENGRLSLIPALAKELNNQASAIKRTYNGRIYSQSTMDKASVDAIALDLGKKTDSTVTLTHVTSSNDGVRVVVDGINVEIDFSKSRLNAQIVEHILKAI
jgi:F-type H+-transporting ATPase subunit delta